MIRQWVSEIRPRDVEIGRQRERQLVAESERSAAVAFENRREIRNRQVQEWGTNRARVRERMNRG